MVELIRSSFSPELCNTTIYGCRGFEQFICDQIDMPGSLSDTLYVVAIQDGHVVGYVELRWLPDALFWNMACTSPGARRKGLVKMMLREALSIARMDNHRKVYLDVFENNVVAVTCHERLGFTRDYMTELWDIPNVISAPSVSGRISGYPQSMLCQKRYGFSMFKMITTGGEHGIGCMGDDWFRVTRPEALTDSEVLSALNSLDSGRRILALLPEKREPDVMPEAARLIVRSMRMSVELELLLENLDRQ